MPPVPVDPARKAAIEKLWRAGVLTWKLDAAQKILHAEILSRRGEDRSVALCSRGWGKTFLGILLCIEQCMSAPNQQVAFVTKTKKQAVGNIRASIETILSDCPRSLRPRYLKNDAEYICPNGSVLSLLGVDSDRYDVIRGRAMNGIFVDECQDIDELDKVIRTVLDPIAQRVNGWMVMVGTVPETGQHDFVGFVREAQASGHCTVKTILECPRYDDAWRDRAMRRAGGADSGIWKREYLSQLVFSDQKQVIPEWTIQRAEGTAATADREAVPGLVREAPRPDMAEKYVAMDFGFARDLTVALFGYHDFATATVVIEDEWTNRGGTTAILAKGIDDKQIELWGVGEGRSASVHRYADGNEARTIHELRTLHKLRFMATEKHAKQAHLNTLRLLVTEGRIVIHPRCKLLIKTLYTAQWNSQFKQYERDSEIGHADALDALLYLVRNVKWLHNPTVQAQHWSGLPAEARGATSAKPSTAVGVLASAFAPRLRPGEKPQLKLIGGSKMSGLRRRR